MPHILTSKHNDIQTPMKSDDGVVFEYIAKSTYEDKIKVVSEDKEFFLTKLLKDDKHLIKLDSTTRVTPIEIAKKALDSYSKIANCEILFSNIATNNNKLKPTQEYLKDISYFVDDFNPIQEICVEVGFGSGRHLLYQAEENPDILYIGLEIHTPSIEQMLKQVKIKGIKNILAVNYDARLFLEFLDSNSVSRIFVHFPVPWDKKPHRRVMSEEFINESMRVLKVGGSLELRTDSPNYYEYNLELLEKFKEYKSTIVKNQPLAISSKYEDRWKRQGKDIWDITIYAKDKSKSIEISKDFSFSKDISIDIDTIKTKLPKKAIVKDGYFIHTEYIYLTKDKTICLLHLTMGSFNKPLAKYIVIKDNDISYFQSNPIPTSANHKAHRLLNDILLEVSDK